MELSLSLTEQLSLLGSGTAGDGQGVAEGLAELASALAEAVPGYAGLRLRIVHSGQPVELTALVEPAAGTDVRSSLRLHLPAGSDAFEDGGRLVVWSTVPGSLVDLAADLDHLLPGEASADLDVDLPPPAASGIVGLDELATIHRAAGLLIERGHDPASVHQTMRVLAERVGLSTRGWAGRLLRLR